MFLALKKKYETLLIHIRRRYTCVARNMVGEASKNFTVEVEDYIIIIIVIIVIIVIIIIIIIVIFIIIIIITIIIVIIIIRWRTKRPSRRTSHTRR